MTARNTHAFKSYAGAAAAVAFLQSAEKEKKERSDVHYMWKVVLVGDVGVGKTSLLTRHIADTECRPGMSSVRSL